MLTQLIKMKRIYRQGLALALIASLFSQTACETSNLGSSAESSQTTNLSLGYEKYTLDNGLEVILHQDDSDPIVAVSILYHVGSNREKPGRTGFAHFFEHMLFQSSENVPKGYFFSKINDLGGTFNGGTWTDGTIYYETVPKDALEKVLWMESDRMGYFINTVTTASLENEKLVVKNEKRQRYDNQPYGHTRYVINQALYPKDHPYNWLTIGSLADLQAATLDDVKEFYNTYYGPNNATMVIAGDFGKEETKAWVNKYFGEIASKDKVADLSPQIPSLTESKKVYHEDSYATLPELTLVWPTVENFNEDAYALDILGDLLSEGKRAPLYKVLVEDEKLAPNPRAYNGSQELAGDFRIVARAFNGKDLDDVHTAVEKALADFNTNSFSDKDLERIKNLQETQLYNNLTSVFGKAYQLAYYNIYAGSPDKLTEEVEKYRAITKDDVMRVFRKYVYGKPHIISSFVPKGAENLIVEGSVKAEVEEEAIDSAVTQTYDEDAAAKDIQKTASTIDRSIEPALNGEATLNSPDVWTTQLDNGLDVYGIAYNELPVIQISLRLKGGAYLENAENAGIANLLTDLMMEGTATKTPEELEDAIGQLGAEISMVAGSEHITLYANCLARNYDATVALINEIMLEPRWDATEFDRIKEAALSSIQQAEANPDAVASDVMNKLLYGENHPAANPVRGTEQSVKNLTIEDLKAYYEQYFVPSLASFNIVGMLDQEKVEQSLTFMENNWANKSVNLPVFEAQPRKGNSSLYFVDVPNAKQSVVRLSRLADLSNPEDYFAATAVNYALGATSGGELFKVLREEKGYTYGAYSGFSRNAMTQGTFNAYSSVQSNVTRPSLETFLEVLQKYQANYSEEELSKTKDALIRKDARAYETPYQKLSVLHNIGFYNMPDDYMQRNQKVISGLTVEGSKQLLEEYLNSDKLTYLVVGDGQTQLTTLKGLPMGDPQVLNKKGEPADSPNAKVEAN